MGALAAEVQQVKPMDRQTMAGIVRARLADGPATLGMLLGAVSRYGREHGEVLEYGAGAVLAFLHVLTLAGELACARARIVRKGMSSDALVWLPAADKPAHKRREAARRERERQRLKEPGEGKDRVVVLSVVQARPGTNSDEEAPGPMEIISRLAGSTTYQEPGSAHGTRPGMTTDEIDFVLACVEDRLAADMARSIACHSALSWPDVLRAGYPYLLDAMRADPLLRSLAAGPRRVRIQYVLQHVYHDLAGHRQRGNKQDAAKQCGMRLQTYRRVYGFIERELHGLAHDAAATAVDTLLGWGMGR